MPISAFTGGRILEVVNTGAQPADQAKSSPENPLAALNFPAQKSKSAAATKVSNDNLFRSVTETLPLEVELLRPLRYRVPLNGGTFDILILKVAVPRHKEESLERWRKKFESEYGISVLLDRSRAFSGVREQLHGWAGGSGLLEAAQIPRLERYLKGFFGRPPAAPPRVLLPENLRDLSHLRFLGIDPDGTRSHEDLLYAEPGSHAGSVRLMVALIDVTQFAEPGNYIDRYAERIGGSIFGTRVCISTLGPDIANGAASFLPGEVRPCWLVEVELGNDGTLLERSISRALVKNHHQMTPEADPGACDSETSLTLGYLKQAAERLYARRLKQKKIILVEREGLGGLIVSESMVAAKASLAQFMLEHKIPAIFKSHTPPTIERKDELTAQARLLGLDVSPACFDDPVQFATLLQKLESSTAANARALLQEILDVFFTRSRFDTVNRGHFGIGVDAYMEVKPRDATGLANQYQLARFFSASGTPLLAQSELERRSARRNRQLRERSSIEFKLRFFEKLRENLQQSGMEHEGVIREVQAKQLLLEVPGFTKWGVVPLDGHAAGAVVQPGAALRARLRGFSLEHMRFLFSAEGRPENPTGLAAL